MRNNRAWDNYVMRIAHNLMTHYEGKDHKEVSLYKCRKEAEKIESVARYLNCTGNIAKMEPQEIYNKLFSLEKSKIKEFNYKSPYFRMLQSSVEKELKNQNLYNLDSERLLSKKFKKIAADYKKTEDIDIKNPNEVGLSNFGIVNEIIKQKKEELAEQLLIPYEELDKIEKNDLEIYQQNQVLHKELNSLGIIKDNGLIRYVSLDPNFVNEIQNIQLYTCEDLKYNASSEEIETVRRLGINIEAPIYKKVCDEIIQKTNNALKESQLSLDYCLKVADTYKLTNGLDIYNVSVSQKLMDGYGKVLNSNHEKAQSIKVVYNNLKRVENRSEDLETLLKYSCSKSNFAIKNGNLIYKNNVKDSIQLPNDSIPDILKKLAREYSACKKKIEICNTEISTYKKDINRIVERNNRASNAQTFKKGPHL